MAALKARLIPGIGCQLVAVTSTLSFLTTLART
jgi:hypothetical protein